MGMQYAPKMSDAAIWSELNALAGERELQINHINKLEREVEGVRDYDQLWEYEEHFIPSAYRMLSLIDDRICVLREQIEKRNAK